MEGIRKNSFLKTGILRSETILKMVKVYDREVFTLHLLTITLRRILNPPGFSRI